MFGVHPDQRFRLYLPDLIGIPSTSKVNAGTSRVFCILGYGIPYDETQFWM
jgi:hypothetical protein